MGAAGARVADGETADQTGQVAGHVGQVGRRREEGAHRAARRRPGDEAVLGGDVLQHPGADGVPFRLVGVEHGSVPANGRGELPAQVHRVLDVEVQALAAGGEVDVGRVAGQQGAAGAVAGCVGEAGQPADLLDRHRAVRGGDSRVHLVGGDGAAEVRGPVRAVAEGEAVQQWLVERDEPAEARRAAERTLPRTDVHAAAAPSGPRPATMSATTP